MVVGVDGRGDDGWLNLSGYGNEAEAGGPGFGGGGRIEGRLCTCCRGYEGALYK
jgi:hypothetical protein